MLSPSSFPTHEIERAPPETVHAWLQAAKDGNTDALAMLFQLHSIVSSRVRGFLSKPLQSVILTLKFRLSSYRLCHQCSQQHRQHSPCHRYHLAP